MTLGSFIERAVGFVWGAVSLVFTVSTGVVIVVVAGAVLGLLKKCFRRLQILSIG